MIPRYFTLTAALLLIPVGSVYASNAKLLTGTVLSAVDGDTIKAKFGSKSATIQLACIYAPEIKQSPWGKQSADTLKQLLPVGKSIKLRTVSTDKYKRIVGEVYVGNTSINLAMVQKGQAVVYPQYLSGCASTKSKFIQSEKTAKGKKLGFWHQTKPVMPWVFRTQKKVVKVSVSKKPQESSQSYEAAENKAKASVKKFMDDYFNLVINKGYDGTTSWCAKYSDFASSLFSPVSSKILDISAYPSANQASVRVMVESSTQGGSPIRKNWNINLEKGDTIVEKQFLKKGDQSTYKYSKNKSGGWCIVTMSES